MTGPSSSRFTIFLGGSPPSGDASCVYAIVLLYMQKSAPAAMLSTENGGTAKVEKIDARKHGIPTRGHFYAVESTGFYGSAVVSIHAF